MERLQGSIVRKNHIFMANGKKRVIGVRGNKEQYGNSVRVHVPKVPKCVFSVSWILVIFIL
jgi:hypothetical protein